MTRLLEPHYLHYPVFGWSPKKPPKLATIPAPSLWPELGKCTVYALSLPSHVGVRAERVVPMDNRSFSLFNIPSTWLSWRDRNNVPQMHHLLGPYTVGFPAQEHHSLP